MRGEKVQKKYKIGLCITGILLAFSLINSVLYFDYKINKQNNESTIVVVNNILSVNYEQGANIKVENNSPTYRFSITNNSNDKVYYYINLNNVFSNNKEIGYHLEESSGRLNINQDKFPAQDAYLANFIEINPNSTHYYTFNIYNTNEFKATINIGIENEIEEYFASTILKNNNQTKDPLTIIGEEIATTNESLILDNDDNGPSYYFRGQVLNNYVSFANNLWRIVKINGDGTVKLILDSNLSATQNMLGQESSDNIQFNQTNISKTLNEFYQNNLMEYDSYIANSLICFDNTISRIDNSVTYYLGYDRALVDYNPIHNCLGSTYNSKIGLLTVDEAILAGASKNSDNKDFYLYTSNITTSWWTMTPATKNNNVSYFSITQNGKINYTDIDSYYRGVRPVINLIKKTIVSGDGTINNPYTIKTL